jgi:Bacterial regulatory helix-turn-helix protein, lysR family
VALVGHGSVSAAAAALHMSQPALSHQIAALEKELGASACAPLSRAFGCAARNGAQQKGQSIWLRQSVQAKHLGCGPNFQGHRYASGLWQTLATRTA